MQCLSVVVGVLKRELKIPVWERWEQELVTFVLGFEVWIETLAGQWQGVASQSLFKISDIFSVEYIKIQNIKL